MRFETVMEYSNSSTARRYNKTDGLCKVTYSNNDVTIGLTIALAILSVITFLLFFLVISRRKKNLKQRYCQREVIAAHQPGSQDSPGVHCEEILGNRSKVIPYDVRRQSDAKLKKLDHDERNRDTSNIPRRLENIFRSGIESGITDHLQHRSFNVDEVPLGGIFIENSCSFLSHADEEQASIHREYRSNRPKVRALYDFEPQEVDDLALKEGDIVDVLEKEKSGWWRGICGSDEGWFPVNYVEMICQTPDGRTISRGSEIAASEDCTDSQARPPLSLERTKSSLNETLRKKMEERHEIVSNSPEDIFKRFDSRNKNLLDSLKKRISMISSNTSEPPIYNYLHGNGVGHEEIHNF